MKDSSCIGKGILILLAIAFFPITILYFVWKSDMDVKPKLIITGILCVGCLIICHVTPKDNLPSTRETPSYTQAVTTAKTTAAKKTTASTATTKATSNKASSTNSVTQTTAVQDVESSTVATTEKVTTATTTTQATTKETTQTTTKATTQTVTEAATEKKTTAQLTTAAPRDVENEVRNYWCNDKTMKIHTDQSCSGLRDAKEENFSWHYDSIANLKAQGYTECKICKPWIG